MSYGLDDNRRLADAEEHNCDIVYPGEDELQLDLDSEDAYEAYEQQFDMLLRLGFLINVIVTSWKSKSGNRHVVLKLDRPLPVERRILLQALLGSDLKREALALARVELGMTNHICLFRPRRPTTDDF